MIQKQETALFFKAMTMWIFSLENIDIDLRKNDFAKWNFLWIKLNDIGLVKHGRTPWNN